MNTSTSLQVLAALATLGSIVLVSATQADAAPGGSFHSVPATNTRPAVRALTQTSIGLPGLGINVKVPSLPKTGLNLPNKISGVGLRPSAPQPARPRRAPGSANSTASTTAPVLPGTTAGGANGGTIKLTPTLPTPGAAASSKCDVIPNCHGTTASTGTLGQGGMRPSNYPMRPQYAGLSWIRLRTGAEASCGPRSGLRGSGANLPGEARLHAPGPDAGRSGRDLQRLHQPGGCRPAAAGSDPAAGGDAVTPLFPTT